MAVEKALASMAAMQQEVLVKGEAAKELLLVDGIEVDIGEEADDM